MADLSKTDVKEAVVSALEPFAKAIATDFQGLRNELKGEIAGVKFDLAEVKSDMKWMRTNSNEIFTKLDGFITLYKNQEERMEIFSKQTMTFEGRISTLEKKVGV
ncbi:MAG: hypothetical protein V1656_00080 [Candidatus Jorgensenbacteria bacterium]